MEKIKMREFPIFEWWRKNVVHEGDLPQYQRKSFYEYYLTKYKICRDYSPSAIAEIGVRWGYSAFSFLCAAPKASYTGFDIIEGRHGGIKDTDTFDYVSELLRTNFPNADITLIHKDTRNLQTISGPYDFIHIDGDHSEQNCYHDIELALASCLNGGLILIDDYDYIAGVKRAVDSFIRQNQTRIAKHFRLPSLRGEYIIKIVTGEKLNGT